MFLSTKEIEKIQRYKQVRIKDGKKMHVYGNNNRFRVATLI